MTVDLQFLATLVINPSSFSNYRENMNDRPAAGLGKIGNPETTLHCGDVIRPLSAQAGVRRGVDARESAKLICKVGLVVVATVQRQFGPRHLHTGVQALHCPLKTLDSAPHLWRQAYFFAKDLRKTPLAPTGALCDLSHRARCRNLCELAECKIYNTFS